MKRSLKLKFIKTMLQNKCLRRPLSGEGGVSAFIGSADHCCDFSVRCESE